MLRGLPLSVLLHLLILSALVVWGGMTPMTPIQPHHVLQVRMATLPEVQPEPEPEPVIPVTPPPAEEPEPTPPEPDPLPPEPEPEPVLPPKDVPEDLVEPADETPEPEPTPPAPDPQPADEVIEATETPTEPVVSGPVATATDEVFPFDHYLRIVQNNIARKWQPRQLGFRGQSQRSCVVHFVIGRSGRVTQVTVVRSSGVSLYDREAIRAVQASRMPPLPPKFTSPQLGVTFTFTLQSGV